MSFYRASFETLHEGVWDRLRRRGDSPFARDYAPAGHGPFDRDPYLGKSKYDTWEALEAEGTPPSASPGFYVDVRMRHGKLMVTWSAGSTGVATFDIESETTARLEGRPKMDKRAMRGTQAYQAVRKFYLALSKRAGRRATIDEVRNFIRALKTAVANDAAMEAM